MQRPDFVVVSSLKRLLPPCRLGLACWPIGAKWGPRLSSAPVFYARAAIDVAHWFPQALQRQVCSTNPASEKRDEIGASGTRLLHSAQRTSAARSLSAIRTSHFFWNLRHLPIGRPAIPPLAPWRIIRFASFGLRPRDPGRNPR